MISRDAFLALLVRLLEDEAISEAQAEILLEQFDAGEIPPLFPPLSPETVERGIDERIVLAALLLLALALGQRDAAQAIGAPAAARALGRIRQIALAEQIQTAYGQEAARLAARLSAGEITLPAWQQGMGDAIRRHLIAQSAAGRGVLGQAELVRLHGLAGEELAYLGRFADRIALGQATGQPMSLAAITQRARSYAGTGRGEFWRGLEAAEIEDDAEDMRGWVVDYNSLDDGATCGPCLDADMAGPYLVGDGPYPGQVCLGRDNCRCTRTTRWDPETYADLAGL